MLAFSAIGMTAFGIGAAYSVNYIMLIILRFFLGVFTAGARNASFVFCEFIDGISYSCDAVP